jgi:hypothetical protein
MLNKLEEIVCSPGDDDFSPTQPHTAELNYLPNETI